MKIIAASLSVLMLFAVVAVADDVIESLDKARALYEKEQYSQAIIELNFAVGLIKDRQIEAYKDLLYDAPSGWTANAVQSDKGVGQMLGGGITVSRTYRSPDGQRITVEMITDSPMLAALNMMLANPMLMGNSRLVVVNGEKAVEEWDSASKGGKLQIMILNRMLITVSGSNLRSREVLYGFAERIDFKKIREIMGEQQGHAM